MTGVHQRLHPRPVTSAFRLERLTDGDLELAHGERRVVCDLLRQRIDLCFYLNQRRRAPELGARAALFVLEDPR